MTKLKEKKKKMKFQLPVVNFPEFLLFPEIFPSALDSLPYARYFTRKELLRIFRSLAQRLHVLRSMQEAKRVRAEREREHETRFNISPTIIWTRMPPSPNVSAPRALPHVCVRVCVYIYGERVNTVDITYIGVHASGRIYFPLALSRPYIGIMQVCIGIGI